ncbi:MAG: 1-acyl-sn-glycerol-3-phosphate acyltransferase [Planctomycetaceae bacterium]|nr:1-acyl-sn-glycerol-3-phosphate acyltransferase [Planctomycetaceae bacterium]
MNRQPFQTPPRYWEPRLTPWWVRLCRPLRQRQVQVRQKITSITSEGGEAVRAAFRSGAGLLFTPNHSTHYDSNCLYLTLETLGFPCHFMTAWQVFGVSSRWDQWSYQRHGCFSVDRERTDLKAFRQAVDILETGRWPLVIFPEGDIHHVNDRVLPFREGAAAIALAAAKKQTREVLCIPTAIKFEYLDDPLPSLQQVVGRLEDRLLLRRRTDLPLIERVFRVARTVLCIQEIEEYGQVRPGDLRERLQNLSRSIVDRIARAESRPTTTKPIPEEVKDLRRRIIDSLEQSTLSTAAREQKERELADLFMAIQFYSYPGDYLQEHPSRERLAETVDKLEEDVLETAYPTVHGRRRVRILFGEPIPIQHNAGTSGQTAQLTNLLEQEVQQMLNRLSRVNERRGMPTEQS